MQIFRSGVKTVIVAGLGLALLSGCKSNPDDQARKQRVDPAGRAIVCADKPTAASSGWATGVADAASTYDVLIRVPIQEFGLVSGSLDGVRRPAGVRTADGSTYLNCPPGRRWNRWSP